jgi:2'-5' RNA ligase
MRYVVTLVAFMLCLAPGIGRSQPPDASSVTAIDIALEPDATMMQHANAINARLRQSFPKGYALDATHRPHVTMLQRYVRTADLNTVYAAVAKIIAAKNPATWKLHAFRIAHAVWSGLALTVIVVKPTTELLALQQQLIDAVAPYTVRSGTAAAFDTTPAEPDINSSTLEYVEAFVPASTGKNYEPHVTVGVASVTFVKTLEAKPFDSFTFSPVAASAYQLGNFGTARKELKTWTFSR